MMRLIGVLALAVLCGWPAAAQMWEVGAAGGYGFVRKLDVSGPANGKTGFESGEAYGAVAGNDMYRYVGGEARYTHRKQTMMVSSGGTKATFDAQSEALHFDLTVHSTPRGARVRPFVAAGLGAKWYRGTGAERSFQPLSNLVVLSHVTQSEPLVSAGAGIKVHVARNALLRFDFRDYATPFPDQLIVPRRDVKVGGWVHDFLFLVGVSASF